MNKRIFLLALPILAMMFVAPAWLGAQQPTPAPAAASAVLAQPTPAPQAAPAIATPAPPAPQAAPSPAAQKPTPAPAQPAPSTGSATGANVRIDVTISDQTGNAAAVKKMMSLVVNRNGSVRSGVNVPMTQMTLGAAGSGGVNTIPVTSYNYRTMGLNLDVINLWVDRSSGLIHVRMSLEYNPIDEAEKPGSPSTVPVSYSNFSQSFELDLDNGKPLLVAQTSDPVPSRNRTLSVEVKATIVK
jgi:hypothetical protein